MPRCSLVGSWKWGTVLDRLRQQENRFLLISGASGSGKFSLVDAGVLSNIEKGALSSVRTYTCVRMVPIAHETLFQAWPSLAKWVAENQ